MQLGEWMPYGVRLDLESGERTRFQGPIYAVSHDRRFAICPNLRRTGLVQAGYGVILPPEAIPRTARSDDDGIFITDLESGDHRLLISVRSLWKVVAASGRSYLADRDDIVGFHMSLNPQADRVIFILRRVRRTSRLGMLIMNLWRYASIAGRKVCRLLHQEWLRAAIRVPQSIFNTLFVVDADGTHPRVVLSEEQYALGGHHPNWCPDGRSILMNRTIKGKMRFSRYFLEDDRWEVLSDRILGSGHPTLHPNGRHILTDAYHFEQVAFGDGTAPIRLIDLNSQSESTLVRMATRPEFGGPKLELRVDPHPAWNEAHTRVAINGYADGTRRVYIADLANLGL
jgi:hypothetical protein